MRPGYMSTHTASKLTYTNLAVQRTTFWWWHDLLVLTTPSPD